ncbi:MAG: hypothetical protein O9294_17925 [Cytophagales bacterium]|jgi:hypothetical protein|nr:hypothetical protein [Cytophagales bacterium]
MRFVNYLVIVLMSTNCGNKSDFKKEYYPNGKLKTEGEFRNGSPIGKHREYFENGNLKIERFYQEGNDRQKLVSQKIYGVDQLIELDRKIVDKDFHFELLRVSDDSVEVLIRLLNPNYEFCLAVVGHVTEDLFTNLESNNKQFIGNNNHEVIVKLPVSTGENVIKGLFSDFKFEPYPHIDTLAYTVAEDSYFEYRFSISSKVNL